MMRNFLWLAIALCFIAPSHAQNPLWVDQMQDPSVNFYTVQQNFEAYWQERTVEKGKGWKQFKRWEAFMEPRVYPEGQRPDPAVLAREYQQMKMTMGNANAGNWQPLGPYDGNALNGIGRFNRLAFHPQNDNIIWAGSPAGGLWKTVDGGQNWTTNTDLLPNLGVSDIVINPLNPQIMYIATGDQDGGDTYSYGVLKSTDGGQSWSSTGLSFGVAQQMRIQALYINPINPQVIIASSRQGIYRSSNGGVNWQRVIAGNYNDLVQKPGDPNILFATSANRIWKSTDNGLSWSMISTASGLPASGISRVELAVTPDDPNMVYALYGASNNGFLGVYRSIDEGNTWNLRASSPNLLGWSVTGGDAGGQAWYDLAIAVHPTNKNRVYVGGVNIWTSNDGGSNWNLEAHWFGGGGAPFVHADIHDLKFSPQNARLYTACDGGVYRKSGTDWDELNQGLNITQYYRLGASATDTNLVICGAQDNGTHLYDTFWDRVRGGDGMECAIDPKNPNIMYSSVYYGNFEKSNDRGNSFNAPFNLPPAGNGNWVTPFLIDPLHPDTLYAGFSRVFRSYNGGLSFTGVSANLTGGANIDEMALAPSDPSHLYISEGSRIWFSTDRGNSFVNQTTNLPGGSQISYITVDPNDPLHVVVSRSGYSSGQKVFESFDGGFAWRNISDNLPNVPANCVVVEDNVANGIYVGTDLGVFYRDDNMDEWIPYNVNLPNVIVNELEITYKDRKLKAATYGRGLWISPLYGDNQPPLPDFTVSNTVCLGDTITLFDRSSYQPDSWSWSISPASYTFVDGTNSNSQNPRVYFTAKALYNITLSVSNENGSSQTTRMSAVAPGGRPIPFSENFESEDYLSLWENSGTDTWLRSPIGGSNGSAFALRAQQYFVSGQRAIISPTLNFENYDSVYLNFDHAYIGRPGATEDTLRIYAAANCSENWLLVKEFTEDSSGNFVTNNPQLQNWTPSSAADWCGSPGFAPCPTVDLSAFAGQEGVRLKFEAASAADNNLYIDNINIDGNSIAAPVAAFSGQKQGCAMRNLSFIDQSYNSPANYTWYFPGSQTPVVNTANPQVMYTAAGTYDVSLVVSNALGTDSIYKAAFVQIDPADTVELNLSNSAMPLCFSDTLLLSLSSVNEGSNPRYRWYLNGTVISGEESSNLSISGLLPGDQIYATLTSSEACAFPQLAYSDTLDVQVYAIPNLVFNAPPRLCISDNAINLSATPAGGSFSGKGVSGNSFDPAVAGPGQHLLTYTYNDSNACVYSETILAEVDEPAVIQLISPGMICKDDNPRLLNIGFPAGGTFSGPGVTANYFFPDSLSPGTYTIYYTYTQGNCPASIDSTTITLVANPPVPSILYNNGVLQSSVTAIFYQWNRNGNRILGANSQTYTPTQNGSYTVEVRDANMCSSFSEAFVLNGVGLDENKDETIVELFPNPAGDFITLRIESSVNIQGSFEISNSIGQRVKQYHLDNETVFEKRIDISQFPAGIYMIMVRTESMDYQKSFVKQ